jgi:hypothetical protein
MAAVACTRDMAAGDDLFAHSRALRTFRMPMAPQFARVPGA